MKGEEKIEGWRGKGLLMGRDEKGVQREGEEGSMEVEEGKERKDREGRRNGGKGRG